MTFCRVKYFPIISIIFDQYIHFPYIVQNLNMMKNDKYLFFKVKKIYSFTCIRWLCKTFEMLSLINFMKNIKFYESDEVTCIQRKSRQFSCVLEINKAYNTFYSIKRLFILLHEY